MNRMSGEKSMRVVMEMMIAPRLPMRVSFTAWNPFPLMR